MAPPDCPAVPVGEWFCARTLAAAIHVGYLGEDPKEAPDIAKKFLEYGLNVANEPAQAFIAAYRQMHNRRPGGAAALTYDAFGLLFEAIKTQASLHGDQIRDGLANVKGYRGVTGLISYRGTGDPVKSAIIVQVKDGQARFYKSIDP